MKQKIKAMLEEERGVSPVIGVILMVAITVILAAVIGTFVLGLGDSLQQAPQSQLDAEAVSGPDVEITHNGGDSIEVGNLRVTLDDGTDTDTASGFVADDLSGGDSEFAVGETLTIASDDLDDTTWDVTGETQVRVIHTPSESIILDTEIDMP